jgi:hypothetical protein
MSNTAEVLVLHRSQQEIDRPLTAVEIRAGVNLIQEVMKGVMKEKVHFGTIPGTPKPTLYKAGAEKLLSTFRIATEPSIVEDLSNADEIRYRVTVSARSCSPPARFLGAAIGECSSSEEKYRWRRPVCEEEFNETPEDRRRKVWKKGEPKAYQQKQVRTNPSDVANTVLKMAHKRALIASRSSSPQHPTSSSRTSRIFLRSCRRRSPPRAPLTALWLPSIRSPRKRPNRRKPRATARRRLPASACHPFASRKQGRTRTGNGSSTSSAFGWPGLHDVQRDARFEGEGAARREVDHHVRVRREGWQAESDSR